MKTVKILNNRLDLLMANHCILESELKNITYKYMKSKRIISKLKNKIRKLESDYNA